MKKNWSLTGASKEQYNFVSHPKSGKLPQKGGVLILAYTHPRGHLAGFQLHILHIGVSANFEESVQNIELNKADAPCWNTTLILSEADEEQREKIYKDLKK